MMPKHLSATSLSLWQRCPNCWMLKYREGVEDEGAAPLYFGRAMARALELGHKGDQDFEVAFVQEYAKQDQIMLAHDMGPLTPSAEHGVSLLKEYAKDPFQGVPEKKIIYQPRSIPVPLIGYLDLLTERDGSPWGVAEYKASGKNWTQKVAQEEIQGKVYFAAFQDMFGKDPDHLTYVILNTNKVQVDRLEVRHGKGEMEAFEDFLEKVYQEMVNGDFVKKCPKCRGVIPRPERNHPVWDWSEEDAA